MALPHTYSAQTSPPSKSHLEPASSSLSPHQPLSPYSFSPPPTLLAARPSSKDPHGARRHLHQPRTERRRRQNRHRPESGHDGQADTFGGINPSCTRIRQAGGARTTTADQIWCTMILGCQCGRRGWVRLCSGDFCGWSTWFRGRLRLGSGEEAWVLQVAWILIFFFFFGLFYEFLGY